MARMNSTAISLVNSRCTHGSVNASDLSAATSSAAKAAIEIATYRSLMRRCSYSSSLFARLATSPSRFSSAAASTRRRSTARPSRPVSTFTIVAMAVSRNTGAIASWITRLISLSGVVLNIRLLRLRRDRKPPRAVALDQLGDEAGSLRLGHEVAQVLRARRAAFRRGDRLLDRGEAAIEEPRPRDFLHVEREARPQAGERIELVGHETIVGSIEAVGANELGMLQGAREVQVVRAAV